MPNSIAGSLQPKLGRVSMSVSYMHLQTIIVGKHSFTIFIVAMYIFVPMPNCDVKLETAWGVGDIGARGLGTGVLHLSTAGIAVMGIDVSVQVRRFLS